MRKAQPNVNRASVNVGGGRAKALETGTGSSSNMGELRTMETRQRATSFCASRSVRFVLAILLMVCAGTLGVDCALRAQTKAPATTQAKASEQETFSTPEEAMKALTEAVRTKDRAALEKIFGPDYDQLLSGDDVEDDKDLNDFATAIQEFANLRKDEDGKYTLVVGKNNWPTPIPIVKRDNVWLFDTKAGIEEILNRRIGENELSAVTTCRAYVVAQWEYFTEGDHDNDGVAEYAQKFISSPGQHDGLYWPTSEDEKPSPLGQLVAEARAEGYGPKEPTSQAEVKTGQGSHARPEDSAHPRHPYHGYYFKILTRQGPHAPGGKYNYIINGDMIAGYALVAYPAKWGNSGIMTFIVNQQGRVYEKNLGANTEKIASAMTEYNPDPSWKLVQP